MAMAVAERVRKVFAIQEERKKQYGRLGKAQLEYSSECWTEEQYQREMQEVTTQFSQLSLNLLSLIAWFRDNGRNEVASILETVQLKEKEKLQLTVQSQVKKQELRQREKDEEEEEEFSTTAHEEKMLRKKLAVVEGDIAELLNDLRFECEPQLLADVADV